MKAFDLSMPINKNTPVFPGDPKPEFVQVARLETEGWNEQRITFTSHFSTHIDAPFHMIAGAKKLSDFSIEKFFGEAIVLDFKKPDFDAVKKGDIVFFYTGNTEKMYSPAFFRSNPQFDKKTAEMLVKKKIKIVGIDSFTIDNEPFEVHKLFLKNNILIVENLCNLKSLVNKRFQCYALPLKLDELDGAPCRVIAVVD